MSGIYKSYDIRGIYPEEINAEAAAKIAKAFLVHFKRKNLLGPEARIVIGCDARNSSPELKAACINAILDAGVSVDDMGVATTDSFYYSVGANDYAGGMHIGASHNPPKYNGIKGVARGVDFVRGEEIEKLLPFIDEISKSDAQGKLREVDFMADFAKHTLSVGDVLSLRTRRTAVLDPGNGTTVRLMPHILPELPIDSIVINDKMDGDFPGRGPNPYAPGATKELSELVLKNNADFGVAWDNDADRIMFVDEKGVAIPGDTLIAIVTPYILSRNPGSTITHDVVTSRSVKEVAEKFGGRTHRTRVGYVNVKKGMMETDSPFGGEISGHFQFPVEAHGIKWTAENSWLTLIYLMHILEESGKKLSELAAEATLYHKSDIIVFETQNSEPILAELKKKNPDAFQDTLDGLTIEYKDWWFNARPSNTEPILKLVVEADSDEKLVQKIEELKAAVSQFVT